MIISAASTDPVTILSSGDIALIQAFIIVVLASIIIWQQKKIDKLFESRLTDSKEIAKEVTEVLQGNSQSNYILAEKIEAARGNK